MEAHKKPGRIQSIDMMRGLCMLAMAVDHVRDHLIRLGHTFFGTGSPLPLNPTDIANAATGIFWLRCVSHIFAPPFLFLAGTGSYLWQQRRGPGHSLFRYLFLRGIMLAALNCLLFSHAPFSPEGSVTLHVLWPIGLSMALLGCIAHWPRALLWPLAVGLIAGQNVLETVSFGSPIPDTLWTMGFGNGNFRLPWGAQVDALWPLMPWFGVMLLGYLCGGVFLKERTEKIRILFISGAVSLSLFLFLRMTGLYGDASHWMIYDEVVKTAGSLINVTKYPPSFQFFLYGFGSMCLIMGVMEKYSLTNRMILAIGGAPLFYYIAHVIVLRAAKWVALHVPASFWAQVQEPVFSLGGILVGGALLALVLWPCCELYTSWMKKRALRRKAAQTTI